jgi:peptide/nickel transport system substrate-binding protein
MLPDVTSMATGVTALAGCPESENGSGDGKENGNGNVNGEPRQGGTLTVAMEDEIPNLDPHIATGGATMTYLYNVYETLVWFDRESGELKGRLAEDWTFEDDGQTVIFDLKQGLQFHEPVGRELVADDVVYSYERMTREGTTIRGDFGPVAEFEAIDDYTVDVSLAMPFTPHVNNQARPRTVILPEETRDSGNELGTIQEPVGTGPFEFSDFQQGDSLTLTAFDDYRADEYPYFDEVELVFTPDDESRSLAVRTGDVDYARELPLSSVGGMENEGGVRTMINRRVNIARLNINCGQEPLDDPDVRRAISHAVDRNGIVEAGAFGYGEPATQPYPTDSPWHSDLDTVREYDIDAAEELLDDAGGIDETITIKHGSGDLVAETMASVTQDSLEDLGVDVETNGMDTASLTGDWIQGNYDILTSIISNPDPHLDYAPFITEAYGLNLSQYDSDQPDHDRMIELLRSGAAVSDRSTRKQSYKELRNLVQDHVPIVEVILVDFVHGLQEDVKGVVQDPTPNPGLRYSSFYDLWLDN